MSIEIVITAVVGFVATVVAYQVGKAVGGDEQFKRSRQIEATTKDAEEAAEAASSPKTPKKKAATETAKKTATKETSVKKSVAKKSAKKTKRPRNKS